MALKFLEPGTDFSSALKKSSPLKDVVIEAIAAYHTEMKSFSFQRALEQIGKIVGLINKEIDLKKPWEMAKSGTPQHKEMLVESLIHWHETLRVACVLYCPFLPESSKKALHFLGDDESLNSVSPISSLKWGSGPILPKIKKPDPIFPRLEQKGL